MLDSNTELFSFSCKEPVDLAIQSLVHEMDGTDKAFDKHLTELEQTLGPLAAGCKDSLLSQISGLSCNDKSEGSVGKDTGDIRLPFGVGVASSASDTRLIEELSSAEASLQKPEFELQVQDGGIFQRQIVLKIQLPGISSAKECSLDISEVRCTIFCVAWYVASARLYFDTNVFIHHGCTLHNSGFIVTCVIFLICNGFQFIWLFQEGSLTFGMDLRVILQCN